MSTLRTILNELRWSAAARPLGVVLEVRTRETGKERIAAVAFESVVEILPKGVTLADGTFLPYHRLVRVRRGADVIWPATEGAAR